MCTFSCRDVVKEDRIQNSKSMDPEYLKSCSSESKLPDELSKSLADEVGIGPRSYSCNSKAFTFSAEKIRDVSLHGVRVQLNIDCMINAILQLCVHWSTIHVSFEVSESQPFVSLL